MIYFSFKCLLKNQNHNLLRKGRKYLHFLCCENEKNMWFSYFCPKLIQNLKHFIKVGVDIRFRSIMLEKCLVSLEKCSVLLEKCFKNYARDRSVIARNFLMLEMLDHFSARDRSDRKFKIKNCARDRSDRKFQCSKCSRSMFLPLGLNSSPM